MPVVNDSVDGEGYGGGDTTVARAVAQNNQQTPSFLSGVQSAIGAGLKTLSGIAASPIGNRLLSVGLAAGGSKATTLVGLAGAAATLFGGPTTTAKGGKPAIGFAGDKADWRVKLSFAGSPPPIPYAGIMEPLASTNGVIFPHTPTLTVQETANYGSQKLVHSNYAQYFYEGSEVPAITISGEFTVQSVAEANYLLAAIYFFRSATKMFFGTGANVGNPPPMLKLNGYGYYYLSDVPCVLTSFSHTMPSEVDYISTTGGDGTRMPTISTISITVQPIYSRKSQRDWSLADFSQGNLIKGKGFL
jgi:hypothetical protein